VRTYLLTVSHRHYWRCYIISSKYGIILLSQLGLAPTARPREDILQLVAFTSKATYLSNSVDLKSNTWFRRAVGYCSLFRVRDGYGSPFLNQFTWHWGGIGRTTRSMIRIKGLSLGMQMRLPNAIWEWPECRLVMDGRHLPLRLLAINYRQWR